MARVRADLCRRARGTRSLVAAHAFVVGGAPSASERDISVGGVGSVPASVFADVHYVALGHLHGRQRLAGTVRYSGSPLAYSFSEAHHVKGSWLVELGAANLGAGAVTSVTEVLAPVPRPLAVLRGELDALLADPAHAAAEDAWCQVVLTDAVRPRGAMARVEQRFPHTLSLAFDPQGAAPGAPNYAASVRGRSDIDVCCGFVEHVRGVGADDAETALLGQALEQARIGAEREGEAA